MSGLRHAAGRRAALGAIALSALAGCTTVALHYPDGRVERRSRDEFAAYVERVFRYHNRVVDDFIVATVLYGDPAAADSELQRAERTMVRACQPLNAVVSARFEQRRVGLRTRLALPRTVPACEQATRHLDRLLPGM